MSFKPPGYCPNCGDYVEEGAAACESCGSCPETGWNEDSIYDGIELPEEFAPEKSDSRLLGTVISIGLVALLVYVFVFR
ncbi:zinc ribbon domain-containing protein [Pelagicoccus sp. NFK12]|uniref:Zinc ribbon domain-containing protein n=1 Tax=Pelagicoccus enzymogenes TaxID=2773457 RepID=A0A927IJZ3_9BACT|nr:zinc ribbon domain-containing protein [Pelagicoccus enzymogenes]MBD5782369.1 zinc ribbon domain-containing protein [Pelagicoccus enzymogenes]